MNKFLGFIVFLFVAWVAFGPTILNSIQEEKNQERMKQIQLEKGGEKRERIQQIKENIQQLEKQINKNPNDDKALFDLGMIYMYDEYINDFTSNSLENFNKGLVFLEKSAELGNINALLKLADLYRPIGCNKDIKSNQEINISCTKEKDIKFEKIQNTLKEKGIIIYKDTTDDLN